MNDSNYRASGDPVRGRILVSTATFRGNHSAPRPPHKSVSARLMETSMNDTELRTSSLPQKEMLRSGEHS